jgi:hypothetical protein
MDANALEKNLLVRLGLAHKEDIVSNLLADLLQESSFLDHWLAFAELSPVAGRSVKVKTRISAGGNIPDIAILVGGAETSQLLVIENKILATEGHAQTKRYSDSATIAGLGKAFGIDGMTRERFRGFYLSLHDEGPKDGFQSIQYSAITAWLQELSNTTGDPVRKLMANDLSQLIEHFHTQDWSGDALLLKTLDQDPCGFGKNFVAFQRIFQDALRDLPRAAEMVHRILDFWRGSGHGHSYYGGKIETDCATHGWYKLLDSTDGNKLWSTSHIEFQYSLASKNLKLALHFETCPYKPENQQAALFKGRESLMEPHAQARAKLMESLRTMKPDGWSLDNRYLQVAYANLNVTPETSIKAFQRQVHCLVEAMIPVLDNAWKEVRT